MTIRPCYFREASAFVKAHHRHHRPPRGHIFSLKAISDKVEGVVTVGRPVARHQDDGVTAEITRLCTLGGKNVCSMLIGAVKRVARAMGFERLISYTLDSEFGASWRAAGMTQTGNVKGAAWSGTYGDCAVRRNDWPLIDKRRWEIRL